MEIPGQFFAEVNIYMVTKTFKAFVSHIAIECPSTWPWLQSGKLIRAGELKKRLYDVESIPLLTGLCTAIRLMSGQRYHLRRSAF